MQTISYDIKSGDSITLWRGIEAQIEFYNFDSLEGDWKFLVDCDWIDGVILSGATQIVSDKLIVTLDEMDSKELAFAIQGKEKLKCKATLTDLSENVIIIQMNVKNRAIQSEPKPIQAYYTKPESDSRFAPLTGLMSLNEIVSADVSNLANNYWTKTEVSEQIANIEKLGIEVVQELPPVSEGKDFTVYLVPISGSANNVYEEYLRINQQWELIGTTAVDLSQYLKKFENFDSPSSFQSIIDLKVDSKNVFNVTAGRSEGRYINIGDYDSQTFPFIKGKALNFVHNGYIALNGHHENTPGGFVIQDGNGIISGANDVTTLSGYSLNNSLQLSGGVLTGDLTISGSIIQNDQEYNLSGFVPMSGFTQVSGQQFTIKNPYNQNVFNVHGYGGYLGIGNSTSGQCGAVSIGNNNSAGQYTVCIGAYNSTNVNNGNNQLFGQGNKTTTTHHTILGRWNEDNLSGVNVCISNGNSDNDRANAILFKTNKTIEIVQPISGDVTLSGDLKIIPSGSSETISINDLIGTLPENYDYLPLSGGDLSGGINFNGLQSGILRVRNTANDLCFLLTEYGQRMSCGIQNNLGGQRGSFALGWDVTANGGNGCLAVGRGIRNLHGSCLIVGKYNQFNNDGVSDNYVFVAGNGSSSSSRSNCFTVDRDGNVEATGDLTVSGYITSKGKQIIPLTGTAFIPQYDKVYQYTLSGNETFDIDVTNYTSGDYFNFDLQLIQQSTPASVTLTGIIWGDQNDNYVSSNPQPDITSGNMLYDIELTFDGTDLLGKLKYTKSLSAPQPPAGDDLTVTSEWIMPITQDEQSGNDIGPALSGQYTLQDSTATGKQRVWKQTVQWDNNGTLTSNDLYIWYMPYSEDEGFGNVWIITLDAPQFYGMFETACQKESDADSPIGLTNWSTSNISGSGNLTIA